MKDIKIRLQKGIELKNKKLHDGLYSVYTNYTEDMKEVEKLINKINESINVDYEYPNNLLYDYYFNCKKLKYYEIYNAYTNNKDDKYLINFYLYDLDKKCRVAENEFWITMQQAKEEDRRLI